MKHLTRRLARRRVRIGVVAGCLAMASITGTVLAAEGWLSPSDNSWPYAGHDRAAVLATVGDTSCQPSAPVEGEKSSDVCSTARWQAQTATANQIESLKPNLVAVLGDEQYQVGRYEDFTGSFDHTYGAFKFLQRPAPGNHEFYTSHGENGVNGYGYFDYYNGYQTNPATGQPSPTVNFGPGESSQPTPLADGQAGHFDSTSGVGDGWYSYNLGGWHIISLNIECATQPGGCNANGTWFASETAWLKHDLALNHAGCTLAYWHQPTFSSTATDWKNDSAEGTLADTWWKLLYARHADVVLNGHDHVYSRFAPMDPNGTADPRHGIREFIVGTGGESLDTLNPTPPPNLQAATDQFYGVMKLTLHRDGYAWDYASAPGAPSPGTGTYSDTGSARCHGGGRD